MTDPTTCPKCGSGDKTKKYTIASSPMPCDLLCEWVPCEDHWHDTPPDSAPRWTQAQIDQIEKEASEIRAKFRPLPVADEAQRELAAARKQP